MSDISTYSNETLQDSCLQRTVSNMLKYWPATNQGHAQGVKEMQNNLKAILLMNELTAEQKLDLVSKLANYKA